MLPPDSIAAKNVGVSGALSAQVENVAVQIVLGGLGIVQRLALLAEISKSAQEVNRHDIAQVINESVKTTKTADPAIIDSLISDCITRVQHLLCNRNSETISNSPGSSASPETPSITPLGEDRELLSDFVMESRDHLSQVEVQMITLEKHPKDAEAINTTFRAFHTIKGLAGFLGMDHIREIAHETETLLDLARNRRLTISSAVVDVVLAAADFLKAALLNLEQSLSGTPHSPLPDQAALTNRLRSAGSIDYEGLVPSVNSEQGNAVQNSVAASLPELTSSERRAPDEHKNQTSDSNCVKVGTAKLDYLVDMAGELVIAESMVRHHPEFAQIHSPALLNSLAQMARITSELQKTAMSMRMVPIGGLFQKMSRLTRDLARKTGKRVELETIGSDTELDRNVVEELADPLMHMVRNAIDHGLELETDRLAAAKDSTGHLRLRAGHQAGHIVIEIADDGRGLDRDRILAKARHMALIEETRSLPDSELFDLIFHPGFSTAVEVTDVSGRGVGMDVVRRKIQKLRGHVEISSSPGTGTTFCLRLPITLAIIDGLVVGVGSERYIVPIFSVREMLRPTAEMVFTVEGVREVALVRDKLLPVVRLYKRFQIQPRSKEAAESLLIVAQVAGRAFCLMVDDLIGKQEVVIKSLGESIKEVPGVAGGAILGDGRVGLILDLEGIFQGVAK
ncbi:MAG: chemotaxis protein CheA [Acidobacteria bacterium]|nr:chemotaxis protein CheA [Acidobacteriota bacterium]